MKKFKNYEDIYPLTIIQMRYGAKYVAFNCTSDIGWVSDVELDEEVHYRLEEYLEENVSPCLYGVGKTIWEALDNLIANQED